MNGKTNSSIIPKSRGLLQKGVKFWKSLKTQPKEVTPKDFKENPVKAITTLLHPRNIANVLVHSAYNPALSSLKK